MKVSKIKSHTHFLIFLTGAIFSVLLFFLLRHDEITLTKEKFSNLIRQYSISIKNSLEQELSTLNALSAYHYGSSYITREEFGVYVKRVFVRHDSVQAIEWVPEVSHAQREKYEKLTQAVGFQNFTFTEKDKKGNIVTAKSRDFYYPVYYLEPYKGNEKAFGLDLGFEQNRLSTLLKAKKSGFITASKPIDLVQGKNHQHGILIFQPIYENANKNAKFEGFYLLVMIGETVIKNSLQKISQSCEGVNIRIYDTEDKEHPVYIDECDSTETSLSDIHARESIEFADRTWIVQATATSMFTSQYTTLYPYIVSFVMLLLSMLISWIFYLMQKSYKVVSDANNNMRRFQKVAIEREKRIVELKEEKAKLEKHLESGYDQ